MLLLLIWSLLLISPVSPSHYVGMSTRLKVVGQNSEGNWILDHYQSGIFEYCSWESWSCYNGGCGSSTGLTQGTVDKSYTDDDDDRNWCEREKIYRREITSLSTFHSRMSSCCWRNTDNNQDDMVASMIMDLGIRSDTSEPNNSPQATILYFLRTPKNCPRVYKIAVLDPEEDKVICRYGKPFSQECELCESVAGFTVDEEKCELTYNYKEDARYASGFEMVVEEFPQKDVTVTSGDGNVVTKCPYQAQCETSKPMSIASLQFVVLVEPAVESCVPGEYIPQYESPTPKEGAHIIADISEELVIYIAASATRSTVADVIFSGHQNFTKEEVADGKFALKWKPTMQDDDNMFNLCFAVESVSGSRYFQSDMRCVIVHARAISAVVSCSPTTMTVAVKKNRPGIQGHHFVLKSPENPICSTETHSNFTHIIASFPLSACGTEIEETANEMHFKNSLISADEEKGVISRKDLLHLDFECLYDKHGSLVQQFNTHRDSLTVTEKGFGTFTYTFEFYEDNTYTKKIDPGRYPLMYYMGSKIYMEIEATTAVNTELFVESCKATPYDAPNDAAMYPIIEDGCKLDPTLVVHSETHSKQYRFFMDAFTFIGEHKQVYITCEVMICETANPNTRCSEGCIDGSSTLRRKREAGTQTAKHYISQGPLRLKRSEDASGFQGLSLSMNMVFLVGALLVAVGIATTGSYLKHKRSVAKYQELPSTGL